MKRKKLFLYVIFVFTFVASCNNQESLITSNQSLKNLKTFAKVYGYIRFFHPSNEANNIEWNKFAIIGCKEIINCADDESLCKKLENLFRPIGSSIQIVNNKNDFRNDNVIENRNDTTSVAWQHMGVLVTDNFNGYLSIRASLNSKIANQSELIKDFIQQKKDFLESVHSVKLFNDLPMAGEFYNTTLDSNLYCRFPLTANIINNDVLEVDVSLLSIYFRQLFINEKSLIADDVYVRLADVIITWNIFQHFFPYFDIIKVDWDKILTETLEEALQNQTSDEFYFTLSKMVAKLQDGHGFVYHKLRDRIGGIPIRVDWIQNQAVITATKNELFKKGDIIVNIDGITAEKHLDNIIQYVSGSPQLKRYRALNRFGMGNLNSYANIDLLRNNKLFQVKVKRESERRGFFNNQISEFDFPTLKKIDKNIYYVNINTTDLGAFQDSIEQLANAKGIIFDTRWDGEIINNFVPVPLGEIVYYLIDTVITTGQRYIPNIIYPDRKNIVYQEERGSIVPKRPNLRGKIVFITDPHVVSYGEMYMNIIEHYKLAELVGNLTAGCDGGVNFFELPGNYKVTWTGQKVQKLDGSQLFLKGIEPTYPVKRTINAVKECRDEYLEKALEVIKNSIK